MIRLTLENQMSGRLFTAVKLGEYRNYRFTADLIARLLVDIWKTTPTRRSACFFKVNWKLSRQDLAILSGPQRKEICDGHSQTYGAAGIRAALKNKPQIKPSDFYCNSFTVGYSANASSRLMISAIAL